MINISKVSVMISLVKKINIFMVLKDQTVPLEQEIILDWSVLLIVLLQ